MPMPRLRRQGIKEIHSMNPNAEHIVDAEWLPPDSHLLYQSYDISIMSEDEDLNLDHYQFVDLTAWALPLYDADEVSMPRWRDLKDLYDKRVPKVDGTAPGTSWGTPQQADQTLGDDDNQLFYRPDRISLMSLEDLNKPMVVYSRRFTLGYPFGAGLRTADNTCKWMKRFQGFVRMGIPTHKPVVIVWVLTNPPPIADDAFEDTALYPADRLWNSLDFLTPDDWRAKVFQHTPFSTEDDWRKWAVHLFVDNNRGDEVLFKPTELHGVFMRDSVYRLTNRSTSEVSPTPQA